MNRQQALADISRALGVFTNTIQTENLAGQFSLNRIAEDVLVPVLQVALDAPQLHNANATALNAPDVDLIDDTARVMVQVTSERTSAKITKTLEGLLERGGFTPDHRLVVFMLTATPLRPTAPTRASWHELTRGKITFDPANDIISPPQLLRLISSRPLEQLVAVRHTLEQSVFGTNHLPLRALLRQQSERQLLTEIKLTKYIPDVFVEEHDVKYLARCFAHPALFLSRIAEEQTRMNLGSFETQMAEMGLRTPVELPPPIKDSASVADAAAQAARASDALERFMQEMAPYGKLPSTPPPELIADPRRLYVFRERSWYLQQSVQFLPYRIGDRLKELAAVKSRVFVLTGKAGQGKTNFVCDFVEQFLWKHDIPCGYLSARRLGAMQGADLAEIVQHALFEGRTTTFVDAATRLSVEAQRSGVPFVLLIDGLNENTHPDFAIQLEGLLERMLQYPSLRMVVTCRSEFFDLRFGRVFQGAVKEASIFAETADHRDRDRQRPALVAGYFKFFALRRQNVAPHVVDILARDKLLLRFFCEAYGARGKPADYEQPTITNIYRDEIFEIYLGQKLKAGGEALMARLHQMESLDPARPLREVLHALLDYMASNWTFANIPRSVVPLTSENALMTLLDEDVILRADLAPAAVLQQTRDVLNFTFDELRDYMLATYLVTEVYPLDPGRFTALLARAVPAATQSLEGLQRFLFHTSRRPQHSSFGAFYRDHPWYDLVYDHEIFNIDPVFVDSADALRVTASVRAGGELARATAQRLAVNWRQVHHPVLNLDLLLAILCSMDNSDVDQLLTQAFSRRHYSERALLDQFVTLVRESLLPKWDLGAREVAGGVLRLLTLLTPLESGHNLYSPAGSALQQVAERDPETAVQVLSWSLGCAARAHRPHVWRLLSHVARAASDNANVLEAARADSTADTEPATKRESSRFMRMARGR